MVTMSSNISGTTRHSRLYSVPESTGEENGQPGSPIIRQVEVSVSTSARIYITVLTTSPRMDLGTRMPARGVPTYHLSHTESPRTPALSSLSLCRGRQVVSFVPSQSVHCLVQAFHRQVPMCCTAALRAEGSISLETFV